MRWRADLTLGEIDLGRFRSTLSPAFALCGTSKESFVPLGSSCNSNVCPGVALCGSVTCTCSAPG
eukprot:7380686-Prymnesium_polylepis.3